MRRFKEKAISFAVALFLLSGCGGGGGGDSTTPTSTPTPTDTTVTTTSTAFVSGTTASATSTTTVGAASSLVPTATTVNDSSAVATLIVDLDNDGVYGSSKDAVYQTAINSDGSFDFGAVEVAENGSKAQLSVEKDNFAPYKKIISLKNGQSVTVNAEMTVPVNTQVVDISDFNATSKQNMFLKLGVSNTISGIKSYAKIMSLNDLKTQADPSFGDTISESVIPLSAFPDSVKLVNAKIKAFDPTKKEDSKYFPGEYKGIGKDSGTMATSEPMQLVSVAFDLISLTDQNGDPIELNASVLTQSKLSPELDYTSCLQTKTRYLSQDQVDMIEAYGDDDNDSTNGFQVPMWYYDAQSGMWRYLGEAEYFAADDPDNTTGSPYVIMCVTENWGEYLNLDYAFALEQPEIVCISAVDQDGNPVDSIRVAAQKETAYEYTYLDSNGTGSISLTSGSVNDYSFYYSGVLTGWTETPIDINSSLKQSNSEGCDYELNLTIENPYSAIVTITAINDDNSTGSGYVNVYNYSYSDYFYKTIYLDSEGKAKVKVKPNTEYTVNYKGTTTTFNVDGIVSGNETADSGKYAYVTIQDVNQPPNTYVYFSPYQISNIAESVNVYISSYDGDGDTINIESLKLNGFELKEGTHYELIDTYSTSGYMYMSIKLLLDNTEVSNIAPNSLAAGTYQLNVVVNDGKNQDTATADLTVNENRAPVVYGAYLLDTDNMYYYITGQIMEGNYTLHAYAYDPDGDMVSLEYTLDGNVVANDEVVQLSKGEHELVVKASDGNLDSNSTFTFYVGNKPPQISMAGANAYMVDISKGETFRLYAYVYDPENDDVNVTAKDSNGSEIVLNQAYPGSNYYVSDEISPANDGILTYAVSATDSSGNVSNTVNVSVEVIRQNQPPIFEKVPTSVTVNVNSSYTFECEATDPEGYEVTYSWSVNDTIYSDSDSTAFTTTFDNSGVYTVSCIATDIEGASSTASATVYVIDPNASGNLVINTQLPGLIVALYDTSTLNIIEEKVTDSTGTAQFNVTGSDRATFSVSVGPDFALTQDMIFSDILQWAIDQGSYLCGEYSPVPDNEKPAECSTLDVCSLYSSNYIPNWLFDFVIANDPDSPTVTADEIDTNNDGSLDSNEIYNAVVDLEDKNGDGKVTWNEFTDENETKIESNFYINVPVRTYNISIDPYYFDDYHHYINDCSTKVNVTVTGFTPYGSIEISGSSYGYISIDANGTGSTTLSYLTPQSDGLYSLFFRYLDSDGNSKFYLLKDKTADEIANITVTPSDFTLIADTKVDIITNNDYLSIIPYYKSLYVNAYTVDYDSNTSQFVRKYVNSPDLTYQISGSKWINDSVTNISYGYEHYNYYGDGTLKQTYNSEDYPYLDITPTFGNDSVGFSGADLAKVNLTKISYSANEYNTTTGESYSAEINFYFTIAPTSVTLPDVSSILPTSVANYFKTSPSYEYLWMEMTEFKNMTEEDFLNAVNDFDFDHHTLYSSGSRRLYIDNLNVDSTLTSQSSTVSNKVERLKTLNPLSIGYDIRKLFEK
ncbi:PKD domain-containing protein [Nitrosophilus labii]|uniref:PKD domain-containing protein n=1 Tax=Nitrosophilus labii TaxID=2706014 RepID=UPI001656935F|nr:PKD domain-containing protein [Nitrosophilus labii]